MRFCRAASLRPVILKALALDLFGGHALFDPERNLLMSANTAKPTPLGVHPPPIDPATLPKFEGGGPPLYRGLVAPTKPKTPRPGWAE